jgi:hypothetical protein
MSARNSGTCNFRKDLDLQKDPFSNMIKLIIVLGSLSSPPRWVQGQGSYAVAPLRLILIGIQGEVRTVVADRCVETD